MLTINLKYDANALAAPQSFRDGVQAAANVLEAAIDDPITVTIEVGYTEYDQGGPAYTPLTDGFSLGGTDPAPSVQISYTALRAALANDETSPSDVEAVNSLPNTASLNGQIEFALSGAEAKVLGAISATDPTIDGYAGFPASFTGDVTAAIIELSHALGLLNGAGVETLVEYTSPGNHLPTSTTDTPAYFSLDGGNTNLANFAVTFDSTLFLNLSNDPLSVLNTSAGVFSTRATALTPLDLDLLGVLGFDVTSTPTLPTPIITPTPTAAGTLPTVTVKNISVPEDTAISVLSFITSVTVASGDSIASYAFYDDGSNGYFAIDGVAQPDNQWVYALDTQLNITDYVGGSSPGSETLFVDAFDYTADAFSRLSEFTATTVIPATADMILRDASNGNYEIYDIGNNAILGASPLGQVGTDYQFAGLGNFSGSDTTDMILRSATTGNFEVYDISNNNITSAASLGQVGLEWQVSGFGNFNGPGTTTDMMLRDSNTGTFEAYDISNNSITSANAIGQVGLEWKVAGFGDFNGDGTTDMLLRDTLTGAFEVYDIENGRLASASSLGQVGTEWQVAGFGDFNGAGTTTDMMLRNVNTGVFELYDINNNTITSAAPIGQVGLEWQVAGFGPLNGAGTSDMVLRDVNNGAFEVYDIANNQLTGAASLGQVGLQYQVGGFAVDPPTSSQSIDSSNSQFIQATAGFAPAAAASTASLFDGTGQEPSSQLFVAPVHSMM